MTKHIAIKQKNKFTPKNTEKEKKIVRDVIRGNIDYLRKSADRKAQISVESGTKAILICALQSADFW